MEATEKKKQKKKNKIYDTHRVKLMHFFSMVALTKKAWNNKDTYEVTGKIEKKNTVIYNRRFGFHFSRKDVDYVS